MIYPSIISRYEKILREQYEVSGKIRHKGEKGRQREDGLKQFLRDHLPEAYGIATGEIFPCIGDRVSPQCDIIIFDRLRMPILGKNNAVQQVPLEAVYAVIEVKSELNSSALSDMRKKIKAIREMPKSSTSLSTAQAPLFFLFGYKFRTKEETCTNFVNDNAINEDLTVTALDSGLTIWLEGHQKPIWLVTSVHEEGHYETLVLFLVCLLEGLNNIELGSSNFFKMLYNYSENP